MAHDYGIAPRFLAITPTRDNDAAPGNRLPDKHSRLFCGKTLDEWCAIQVWSSLYAGRHIFVAETEEHAEKLVYLTKYGAEIWVRPRDMLSPLNDSGGIILHWATKKALAENWHTLITHPFVVSPCRSPGFFDRMVGGYVNTFGNPDQNRGQMLLMGGCRTDQAMFAKGKDGYGTQLGEAYINADTSWRISYETHYMALSAWWVSYYEVFNSRISTTFSPVIHDIEPWEDLHIDTQDQWDEAEFWFGKKILSQGEDCYERYRKGWAGGSDGHLDSRM